MTGITRKTSGCGREMANLSSEWCALGSSDMQLVDYASLCRTIQPGELLFCEGDPCEGVYFIKSGLIGVRKEDAEGNSTLLRLAYPGDTLGYRPLLARESYRASAEVLKPGWVCFLAASTMWQLMARNPQLGTRFLQRAARSLGECQERFHETVTLSVRARFAHLLDSLKEHCALPEQNDGSPLVLELPLSRCDLACMLGVRRESLSRIIRDLERDGVAHFSGRYVRIDSDARLLEEFVTK